MIAFTAYSDDFFKKNIICYYYEDSSHKKISSLETTFNHLYLDEIDFLLDEYSIKKIDITSESQFQMIDQVGNDFLKKKIRGKDLKKILSQSKHYLVYSEKEAKKILSICESLKSRSSYDDNQSESFVFHSVRIADELEKKSTIRSHFSFRGYPISVIFNSDFFKLLDYNYLRESNFIPTKNLIHDVKPLGKKILEFSEKSGKKIFLDIHSIIALNEFDQSLVTYFGKEKLKFSSFEKEKKLFKEKKQRIAHVSLFSTRGFAYIALSLGNIVINSLYTSITNDTEKTFSYSLVPVSDFIRLIRYSYLNLIYSFLKDDFFIEEQINQKFFKKKSILLMISHLIDFEKFDISYLSSIEKKEVLSKIKSLISESKKSKKNKSKSQIENLLIDIFLNAKKEITKQYLDSKINLP